MKKQLITIISIGGATAIVLMLVLIYVGFDISQRTERIKESRLILNYSSRTGEKLAFLRLDLTAFEPYAGGLENALPDKEQLINLPRDLKTMAFQNSINITSNFSGEEFKSSSNFNWLGLTVGADGKFDNLINFLKLLDNSRYSVRFENIDLSSNSGGFKGSFVGKVFYYQK